MPELNTQELSDSRATDPNLALSSLRLEVVREAESWLGTPFHHQGRLKGIGVDCAMLVAEVYEACGLCPHIPTEYYPPDWHMHRNVERYMQRVLLYSREVAHPLVGDVAMVKMGRVFSHGAIVTGYPYIIHAYFASGDVRRGLLYNIPFTGREVRFFSPLAFDLKGGS